MFGKLSLKTIYKLGSLAKAGTKLSSRLFPNEVNYVVNYNGSSVAVVFTEDFHGSRFDSSKMVNAVADLGLLPLYDGERNEVVIYSKKIGSDERCGCGSVGPLHNERNGFVATYDSHPGQILVQGSRGLTDLNLMDRYIKLVNKK